MYEQLLYLDILYLISEQKIYARATDQVTVFSTQSIPYPREDDIIVTDHGESGKDIEIHLTVTGPVSETTRTGELVIPVEILQTEEELDEQGVRNLIGSKVYHVSCIVYRDHVVQNSKSDQVARNTNVEIK
jgi:hypothetical protein